MMSDSAVGGLVIAGGVGIAWLLSIPPLGIRGRLRRWAAGFAWRHGPAPATGQTCAMCARPLRIGSRFCAFCGMCLTEGERDRAGRVDSSHAWKAGYTKPPAGGMIQRVTNHEDGSTTVNVRPGLGQTNG